MKKSEVKLKKTANAENIAQILSDLADSFRSGTVCIENGDEFVTLSADSEVMIEMELEAGQKKNKQKFELELSWKIGATKLNDSEGFKISSKEPEITEPSPIITEEISDIDTEQ